MAEVIWAEPALNDLDAIADHIALDNPEAARRLVQKIFEHVDHLKKHPRLGSKPEEIKGWRYRQIVERRVVSSTAKICASPDTHVMRSEACLGPNYLAIEIHIDQPSLGLTISR